MSCMFLFKCCRSEKQNYNDVSQSAESKQINIIDWLMNCKMINGNQFQITMAWNERIEELKVIISQGADVNARKDLNPAATFGNSTVLHAAIYSQAPVEMFQVLLDSGANSLLKDVQGDNAIMCVEKEIYRIESTNYFQAIGHNQTCYHPMITRHRELCKILPLLQEYTKEIFIRPQ